LNIIIYIFKKTRNHQKLRNHQIKKSQIILFYLKTTIKWILLLTNFGGKGREKQIWISITKVFFIVILI